MKILNTLNLQTFDLKESISNLLGGRLQVGQTLYFTFNTINKNLKKQKLTLAQFLRIISFSYPRMSRRTLSRTYRVYERIVLGTGLWISDLEKIDFILLARIAECKNIGSLTRRELVKEVQKRMEAGDNYSQISKQLGGTLRYYREHPPRIPEVVQDVDHRLADVKMDMRLYNSAKNPPLPPPKVPIEFPGLELPRVVIDWDKLKSE